MVIFKEYERPAETSKAWYLTYGSIIIYSLRSFPQYGENTINNF